MALFKKGEKIGKYIVNSFIKKGASAESYTVYGGDDMLYFCKIFNMTDTPSSMLFEGKEVFEIVFCKELSAERNENIIHYIDNGGFSKGGKEYHYLVTEFYPGELLSEAVEKEGVFDVEDASQIALCVLNGLKYMHAKALLHNDITPSNIMLKELEDGMLQPTIIDLGHVSYMVMGRPNFFVGDLAPFFRAPETYRGIYTPKSDVFSVGALLYYLIFGKAPWETDISACGDNLDLVRDKVKEARKAPLALEMGGIELPDFMKEILKKALSLNMARRFHSADSFFKKLMEKIAPEESEGDERPEDESQSVLDNLENALKNALTPQQFQPIPFKKGSGSGFDQVAGRDELKEQLRKEVIFAMQHPDKAQLYQLPKINGILFYGPPGCGKSLVMECFAEELGFNYTILKASDFGNIYQPGVLDNLQRIFDAASIKAPFVLCFDELEYLIPAPGTEGITKESVAMLNLMNDCAEKGVLLVVSSSQPDQVDPFLLRPGCIDRVFFVPQPDFAARKDIFKKHLSNRPCDEIDYEELARLSDDFVAGDITETVNEAAMTAAYMDVPISQKILVDVLKYKNPTYSTKTKIGFHK
ncbi:MAG: AAA family ATPase [Bacteroidales bacterium]|nr:AAA family ATPase [Bacteroidales bacterium]